MVRRRSPRGAVSLPSDCLNGSANIGQGVRGTRPNGNHSPPGIRRRLSVDLWTIWSATISGSVFLRAGYGQLFQIPGSAVLGSVKIIPGLPRHENSLASTG